MMKQRSNLWQTTRWKILAGALIVASLAAMPNSATAAEAMKPAYVSGGIGDDDPIVATKANYNLHLLFAAKGSGEYLADVDVSIAKANGDKMMDAISSGPFFYVELPAGRYRITATFDGKSLSKTTLINKTSAKDLHFYW